MNIHGYNVQRDTAGNFRITPPGALTWNEPAVNLETARRWIEQHQAERRYRAAVMVKRITLPSIMAPEELRD